MQVVCWENKIEGNIKVTLKATNNDDQERYQILLLRYRSLVPCPALISKMPLRSVAI